MGKKTNQTVGSGRIWSTPFLFRCAVYPYVSFSLFFLALLDFSLFLLLSCLQFFKAVTRGEFDCVLLEAALCDVYAPVDLDGQVHIVVDVAPEIYEFV